MRFGAGKTILLTQVGIRRSCAWLLCLVLLLSPGVLSAGQAGAARKLQVQVYRGGNLIHQDRIPEGKDVVVRVTDDAGTAITGAAVVFQLPSDGPGGAFPEDSRFETVMTDAEGLATAKGFQPNTTPGEFKIQVTASYRDYQSASASVMQTNGEAVAKPDVAVVRKSGSGKAIAIAVVVAGAAAGLAFGLGGGGGGNSGPSGPPAPPPTVITPGTPSFGGP